MENKEFSQSHLTIIAPDVKIEGNLTIRHELHLYGKVIGEIKGEPGSTLLIKEGAHVNGKIFAESLIIEGFIQGEIECTQRLWITARGRVVGSVKSPSLQVDSGALFDARVKM